MRARQRARYAPIALPFAHDVDVAPQLVAVAVARMTLDALHVALESAHPDHLALPVRERRDLDDGDDDDDDDDDDDVMRPDERAALVGRAVLVLASRLDDYDAAVVRQNALHHDDSFPF